MKKGVIYICLLIILSSCVNTKESFVQLDSVGKINRVLVVMKTNYWQGEVGDNFREEIGKPLVGLPQPESVFSLSQVDPKGFSKFVNRQRNILIVELSENETFQVKKDIYAAPQTIVYLTAKTEKALKEKLISNTQKIIDTFRNAEINFMQKIINNDKHDADEYKTLNNLGVTLNIPKSYRTVDDTGEFLWLRQHLLSGIVKGDGTNNILVYSMPLMDENDIPNKIIGIRDTIGKKYIPGAKEGMHMITEAAYTPQTIKTTLEKNVAFETRGKWEVKGDFMAGPFLNYTIVDKKNSRLLIVEGFTYAPSVNKREFIFELESIAKTLNIKN